ncbi:MAG TPA: hypothetical protein VHD56_08365 [Tepidisphaeraceae bacterium]|nr:hypothetical protein [Tepidisphaeraceae bacterium]
MFEPFIARMKITFFFVLFFAPIFATAYSRHVDYSVAQHQYLPPIDSAADISR